MNRPMTEGGSGNAALRKFGAVEGDLINDPMNNLEGELGNLSKDDLKERLLVAEKVMKSLF